MVRKWSCADAEGEILAEACGSETLGAVAQPIESEPATLMKWQHVHRLHFRWNLLSLETFVTAELIEFF